MSYTIPSAPPQTAPSALPPITVLVLRDGNGRLANDYWFEGGAQVIIPIEQLDLPTLLLQFVPSLIKTRTHWGAD